MSDAIVPVTSADYDTVVAGSELPVLIDFWAPWCGPCRMMEPVLEEVAAEHGAAIKVVKVNVDEAPDIAQRFDILSIPTLVVVVGGKEAKRVSGARPKPALVKELSAWIG
jgi:thioredoxin 1